MAIGGESYMKPIYKDNLADVMDFSAPAQKTSKYVAKGNLSKKLFGGSPK